MIYGYMRVSSEEQNLIRQEIELKKFKVDKIISDKTSGKDINENLNQLLDILQENDKLIVCSLDRLGRSLQNNLNIINYLKDNNIDFVSIKENIVITTDNTDPMNEFIFTIFSSVAQLERSMIKERQKQGINARKRRKPNTYNAQAVKRSKMLQNKAFRSDIKTKQREYVMKKWNMSRATYFNYKRMIIKKIDN